MSDRTLPWWLRLPLLGMGISQLFFGITLLASPEAISRLWPWTLTPATARLLGASTLVSVPLALIPVAVNRWSVARIPVFMVLVYRVLQIAAGLIHYDRFDFSQPATWNYFGGGTLMMLVLAYALVRDDTIAAPADPPGGWLRGDASLRLAGLARALLYAVIALYLVVGLLFLILGVGAAPLWFESGGTLTALTARLFSSPVTGLALGLLLMTRASFWRAVAIPAIGMMTFGLSGGLAMLLEASGIEPPTPLGYLIPLTPLVLLVVGLYLFFAARGSPAAQ
ncbi:MAG TPA: hypothetical protein VER55_15490 [Ardenticatenaceae bacterium]|nr:hypothetical protein [Ardenticatenaceae bacterium]